MKLWVIFPLVIAYGMGVLFWQGLKALVHQAIQKHNEPRGNH